MSGLNKRNKKNIIVSASRRTDLPAFFPEKTIKHILSLNEGQSTLSKSNIVDGVVFWSKNPQPIIPYLHLLDNQKIPYYFHFTLNNYPILETNVPSLQSRIETFIELSETIGKEKVIWRYDPILTRHTMIYPLHIIQSIRQIGNDIHKYTDKLVFSFLDVYPKTPKYLLSPDMFQRIDFVNELKSINKQWNLKLATCAELTNYEGIEHNKCIDPELFKKLGVDIENPSLKDSTQRNTCSCFPSIDIGNYKTCEHRCLYCYAK